MSLKAVLLVLFLYLLDWHCAVAITSGDLYTADTDIQTLTGDDENSLRIELAPPFRFFGISYTDIYVRS